MRRSLMRSLKRVRGEKGGRDGKKIKPKKKLKCGEYGKYGDLKKKTGDGKFDRDHIPSKAALKKRAAELLNRKLKPAEERAIDNAAAAIAIPRQAHIDISPPHGQSPLEAAKDAKDLAGSARRDVEAMLGKIDEYDADGGCKKAYQKAAGRILRMSNKDFDNTALPYDLLGIEFGDARIQALLTEYGLPLKRPKVKRGDFDAGIEVEKEGVDLVFSLVEAIPSMEGSGLPEGALVLSAVFLYPDAKGKRPGFKDRIATRLLLRRARSFELVNALEIVEKPQLPKGDDTAYLVSEQRGVELTFVDERYLDAPPTREYPEGALVLNNVRFYGVAGSRFKRFDGELPHGLAFGQTLDQLKAKLGATTWESSDSDRAREGGCQRAPDAGGRGMTNALGFDRLLATLGWSADSPEFETLWSELNTLSRPEHPDAEERRYHDWVLAASARFRWGHGDMVLSQLYFYSGHDDIQRYAGTLPFGLQWAMTDRSRRRRLAAFEDSRHSHLTDAWDLPGYRLTAVYADDTGGLSRVVCRRLPEPVPSGHAAVVPPLLSLIGAFGESVASQAFAGLWDPALWTSDQLTQAREDGAVDLNAACGVTVGVVGEGWVVMEWTAAVWTRLRGQPGNSVQEGGFPSCSACRFSPDRACRVARGVIHDACAVQQRRQPADSREADGAGDLAMRRG
ncbi:DNase CdiA [Ditylenchus destructor]|nr:DNase CdiA [Ditylenchus destructor]